MIKIMLVDDETSVRYGLRMRFELEVDLEIVGEAENGLEALKLVADYDPDVIVMDVKMAIMDGIEATRKIKQQYPSIAVIILSIHNDLYTREKARTAGAVSFIEKKGSVEELIRAIRQAFLSK